MHVVKYPLTSPLSFFLSNIWQYAVESQIAWHGLAPEQCMVLIGPDAGEYEIRTEKILSYIDEHATDAALIFLPGIQYYTGQLFDIPKITEYAHRCNLVVGWDLAHAYANVDMKLHDWNVDFAAWCTYKYGNAGPGAIGGIFVHEKHGTVDYSQGEDAPSFRHRLTGWYGGDRSVRFKMDNSESTLIRGEKEEAKLTKKRVQTYSWSRWFSNIQSICH